MFTDPVKNIKTLGLRETDIVADLGAGTGFYSVALGHIVTRGKVYAVEISKDFLEVIKNKVRDAHIGNVEIIWGDLEKLCGTKLRDGIVDAVIASDVFFQLEKREQFVLEVKRILKPKGKVLLIDWATHSPVLGFKKAIPKDKAREMFEKQGFIWQRDIDAGAHHYGMILIRHA